MTDKNAGLKERRQNMPQVWGRGLDLRDTVPKNATESFHRMGIKISELLLADGICRWDVTSVLKRLIQTDLLKVSHMMLFYRKDGVFSSHTRILTLVSFSHMPSLQPGAKRSCVMNSRLISCSLCCSIPDFTCVITL